MDGHKVGIIFKLSVYNQFSHLFPFSVYGFIIEGIKIKIESVRALSVLIPMFFVPF